MASNSFGTLFRVTTFGESHGEGVGCVIDGCPAGLAVSTADIMPELKKRAPGRHHGTSSRKEQDQVEILSGVFDGKTTGAPIALWIANNDVDSSSYNSSVLRPGAADVTYWIKYGHVDYRGGGRASARETAARVAAGGIAKKLLQGIGVSVTAWLSRIGQIVLPFAASSDDEGKVAALLQSLLDEGESIGGIVSCRIDNVPPGLGDPIYEKLSAKLAFAMLSIPASRGFEIGEGFSAAEMTGSEHNDPLCIHDGRIQSSTNHAGGTLGGISTGMPIEFRVAFKPTSSIRKEIATVTKQMTAAVRSTQNTERHDRCVAIRGASVVEAMAALIIADAWLMSTVASFKTPLE
jgi:chorismate synthase